MTTVTIDVPQPIYERLRSEEVSVVLARGGPSLSEIVLEMRGPKE